MNNFIDIAKVVVVLLVSGIVVGNLLVLLVGMLRNGWHRGIPEFQPQHVDGLTDHDYERQKLRDLRRLLWQAAGRNDGVGLDSELIDVVKDWKEAAIRRGAEVDQLSAEVKRLRSVIERVQKFCNESGRWRRRLVDVEDVRRLLDGEEEQ